MKCSACSAENPATAVYCSQCGHKFTENEQAAAGVVSRPPFQPQLPRGNGILILIFGIIGLITCLPLGVAAWLMGNNDLQKMRAGLISREEEGITQAGRILGIIATVFFLIVIGILVLVFGFAFQFWQSETWRPLL